MRVSDHDKALVAFNIILLVFMLFMTILFWTTSLDLTVSRYFQNAEGLWIGPDIPYLAFYYFPMNAILFALPLMIAFPLFLLSFSTRPYFDRIRHYRRHSLLLVVSTALGAGFFNSVVLKALFARPRPMAYFNGDGIYYRPFEIAFSHWGLLDASFPSGHASVAFASVGFFFAFRHAPGFWRKTAKWGLGMTLPVVAGSSMMVSRVSYGEHYVSDTLWAGAFTYAFVLAMYQLLKIPEHDAIIAASRPADQVPATWRDVGIIAASILVPILFAGYLILRFNGLTSI
ncbi:MAG: phosphatase PAP2 family protein [Acholeplasmataceae bacterium]|nr:MAG: phosphatase PAP2 family protein [Acholeplasmataceae bacterium]